VRRLDCRGRDRLEPGEAALVAAVARSGGVIAFPTDTVYALGADPRSSAGVTAVYRAKGREAGKPLPVLLARDALVADFAAGVPPGAAVLMRVFWPGALTILLAAREGLPAGVRSTAGEVALRVPGGALCRAVLAAAGGALTGTSANPAGAGGGTDPAGIAAALGGRVDILVDAGTLPPSPVSSIVRIDGAGGAVMVREGAVGRERIEGALAAAGAPPGHG